MSGPAWARPRLRRRWLAAAIALALVPVGVIAYSVTSASAAATLFEAENATLSSATVATNHPGFTGTGFADYSASAGGFVQWTISGATASTTNIVLRYSNGSTANRPLDIAVNGVTVRAGLAFPTTGSWNTWATVSTPVTLTDGTNIIRATATAAAGGPNVDSLSADISGGTVDNKPPTMPTNPRVSNLTCKTVDFAWDASTDNVGVAFYDIFHDGQLIKTVPGTQTSVIGLPVVEMVTWGLYVQARDAAANVSDSSDTVTITPPRCMPDPIPPTAPGNLRGTAAGTTVTLNWTASTDNVQVLSYEIFRDNVHVGSVNGSIGTPPATTTNDVAPAPDTDFAYYVVATDPTGNVSPKSNTTIVHTGSRCLDVCGAVQVTSDTDIPWGLVTLPDGTILYNRRDAHDIIHLNPTTGVKKNIGTVPNAQSTNGEGGLCGLEINPVTYNSDHWLYIMHTSSSDNRIVRIKYDPVADTLLTSTEQVLLTGIVKNKFHDGGRLRFQPDGTKLFASAGDGQSGSRAQDNNSLNGKILRINPDGTIPSDNPFGNAVWSKGHRNPQGLAFDANGNLWEQEFGNSIMDETNVIVRGGNYGWPSCEGTSGNCGGFIVPKSTYPVGSGSCSGLTVVHQALYVACERGMRLYRFTISGTTLSNKASFFQGSFGRLRTVEPAPGGKMWMTTSNGDKDSTPNNSSTKIFLVSVS